MSGGEMLQCCGVLVFCVFFKEIVWPLVVSSAVAFMAVRQTSRHTAELKGHRHSLVSRKRGCVIG